MNAKNKELVGFLKDQEIPFEEGVELRKWTWFKTGGLAGFIVSPKNQHQLATAIRSLTKLGIPFRVVGQTTNLLFHDDERYTCLVSTVAMNGLSIDRKTREIRAECGVMLPDLSRIALLEDATGFAGLEGIPGTVGGAVFMNAGAYGDNIERILKQVVVMSSNGKAEILEVADLGFGYRESIFRRREDERIIVEAVFNLRDGDPVMIRGKMELFHAKRHRYNDYCYPNLGSVFAGSVYRALAQKNFYYWMISSLFYFFNYQCKIFRREAPINRKWLNDITLRIFDISFEKQPFSDKTMNTIVNNGQHSSVYVEYIRRISELIDNEVVVENEIVEPF